MTKSETGKNVQHRWNTLFVCSMNRWRSPTAEKVFADHPNIEARSGGTSRNAVRPVQSADLKWADLILVMEQKHASRLRSDFPSELKYTKLFVLDIPDDYKYMDPILIEEIESATAHVLNNLTASEKPT